MKNQSLLKKTGAFILTICMILTMMVGVIPAKVQAADTYDLYFLNSEGWTTVNAYIWGAAQADPLGGWPGTTATAAPELGDDWVKVSVSCTGSYHVIFFNKAADAERVDAEVNTAAGEVYVSLYSTKAYATQEAAEASVPAVFPIYFLNSDEWAEVGAYIYGAKGELLGSWGTTKAVASTELGGNWMQVNVSAAPPYNITFYNVADDTQRAELLVDTADKIYVTADAQAYASQDAAEMAMGVVPVYPVYFLNTDQWATVGAYIYGAKGELLGGWGNTTAVPATELGGDWVKVNVSAAPPYSIIFYNVANQDAQRAELYLGKADLIYVTANGQAYNSQAAAEVAMGIAPTYPIYFLNTNQWATVGAYIYGDQGELLGGWGTTTATASELGGDWMQVDVSAEPPYSVIFYNTADETQKIELYIDAANKIYVTVEAVAYTSQATAEASMGIGELETYPIYFLNSNEWAEVGAYIYGDQGELLGSWGTTTATAATELGGNWMQVDVLAEPPYNIVFYNTADSDNQRAELLVDAANKIYVTVNAKAFTTKEAAEASLNEVATEPIYFLNAYLWEGVGAYAYYENEDGVYVEPLGSWGTSIATAATELGGNWVQVLATEQPPYSVIFYNTADDTQRVEYYIDSADNIYATVKNVAFASQAEAEAWNNSGVEQWNMTLGEDLGVHFYLNIDETLAANTDVTITVAGQSVTPVVNGNTYSIYLAAAQMTDEVVVSLNVGESNLYYNTYTVRGYADYILAGEYSAETKALVREMLNYGAAAQTYFAYNTNNLANAGMEATEQVAVPTSAATEMSVSGELEGISFYGASLLFKSKTAVRFYFTGDISGCTFAVDGAPLTPVEKDGMHYVEVADINPQDLDAAITLTVNGELSVTYSPMNYIVRMSEKGSAELQTLLLAMYNYYLAACEL